MGDWCVMFVKTAKVQLFNSANKDTWISAGDRIIFGTNNLYQLRRSFSEQNINAPELLAGTVKTADGSEVASRSVQRFALEMDCFVFSRDLAGDGKVLGGPRHAREVFGKSKEESTIDFRARYGLSVAGIGVPETDGRFSIEWIPQPTFVVKPGYLGIVPRVPLISGRTQREAAFDNIRGPCKDKK